MHPPFTILVKDIMYSFTHIKQFTFKLNYKNEMNLNQVHAGVHLYM